MFGLGKKRIIISAPVEGYSIPISSVNDPAFSNDILGCGIAIKPSSNRIVAPARGTINVIFKTGHAVGLTTDNGIEILIHVGLDTVKLKGQYFTIRCKNGERVKKGDVLIEFDREAIDACGYDTVTPVVICNPQDFSEITFIDPAFVQEGSDLIYIKK